MGIRRLREEEHENNERWVLSYADFITLLFAFFVVMYSISSVNEGKYKVLSESMVEAFRPLQKSDQPIDLGNTASPPQLSVIDFPEWVKEMESFDEGLKESQETQVDDSEAQETSVEEVKESPEDQQLERITSQLESTLSEYIDEGLVSVNKKDLWIEVEIKSRILFDSGMVDISAQAEPILIALARAVSSLPNKIKVEGHTDNVPIVTNIYPSNWELSAARAVAVVQLLILGGVGPERLAAVGLGEFQPIESNFFESGRARNRRVVVVIARQEKVSKNDNVVTEEVNGLRANEFLDGAAEDGAGERELELKPVPSPIKPIRLRGGGLLFTKESLEAQQRDQGQDQDQDQE